MVGMAAILLSTSLALGQSRTEIRDRSSASEKLGYFAGTWTIEVQTRATGFPSSTFFATQHNEWMPHHSFLVSRQEGDTSLESSELAVMAYDSSQKVYTYRLVKNNGQEEILRGTLEGNMWIWTSQGSARQGSNSTTRLIITALSPTSYTLIIQAASDAQDWSTILEGRAIKVVPRARQDVAFLR